MPASSPRSQGGHVVAPRLRAVLFDRCWRQALLLLLMAAVRLAAAQPGVSPAPAGSDPASPLSEPDVSAWLQRLHDASRERNYVGTFVISSASGALASARIWHACEGAQQIERVETLSGAPRSVFRHNDRVVTFLPALRVARSEQRESLKSFPGLLRSLDAQITDFYSATPAGSGRVAGLEADVVQLTPKDELRFGLRVWSDRQSSLVLKIQTLGGDGAVLEQAAFSELELDAPIPTGEIEKMMSATEGWHLEKPMLVKTTPEFMGWRLQEPVAGFRALHCYQRSLGGGLDAETQASPGAAMQWVFSDGLASVSLFVEPFDARRHAHSGRMAMGATHALSRRVGAADGDENSGDWWLTAVGEVPYRTLQLFGQRLRRMEPKK